MFFKVNRLSVLIQSMFFLPLVPTYESWDVLAGRPAIALWTTLSWLFRQLSYGWTGCPALYVAWRVIADLWLWSCIPWFEDKGRNWIHEVHIWICGSGLVRNETHPKHRIHISSPWKARTLIIRRTPRKTAQGEKYPRQSSVDSFPNPISPPKLADRLSDFLPIDQLQRIFALGGGVGEGTVDNATAIFLPSAV
jgi:hypothetical protein